MTITRVFKSGNSQAVRLPRDMRVNADELEIIQHGDTLILRPVRTEQSLASAFDALASLSDDFLPEGRQQDALQQREEL